MELAKRIYTIEREPQTRSEVVNNYNCLFVYADRSWSICNGMDNAVPIPLHYGDNELDAAKKDINYAVAKIFKGWSGGMEIMVPQDMLLDAAEESPLVWLYWATRFLSFIDHVNGKKRETREIKPEDEDVSVSSKNDVYTISLDKLVGSVKKNAPVVPDEDNQISMF